MLHSATRPWPLARHPSSAIEPHHPRHLPTPACLPSLHSSKCTGPMHSSAKRRSVSLNHTNGKARRCRNAWCLVGGPPQASRRWPRARASKPPSAASRWQAWLYLPPGARRDRALYTLTCGPQSRRKQGRSAPGVEKSYAQNRAERMLFNRQISRHAVDQWWGQSPGRWAPYSGSCQPSWNSAAQHAVTHEAALLAAPTPACSSL